LSRAISALVVTVGGTYAALLPRSAPHDEHHDDHGEEHEEKEAKEEEAPVEEKSEEKSEDSAKEDGKSEEGGEEKASGKEKSPKEDSEDKPSSPSSSSEVSHKGPTKNKDDTKKHEEGATGKKLRIDSASGKTIGEGTSSGEGDAFSKKQSGLSNTDTKHSTEPHLDPEKSKKGEGTAETAKIKGTVDPSRKQV
jgi:hypothetical protein